MLRSKISLLVVPMLLLSSFGLLFVATESAKADTFYYGSWLPSSLNSTYWTVYPHYSGSETSEYEVQVAYESYLDLYTTSSGLLRYVETNDFNNTDYNDLNESDEYVWYMPPSNATVTSVRVIALFIYQFPETVLYYSTDDESTWETSSVYPAGGGGISPYGAVTWNVTSLESWTPALLNSTDTWVKAKFTPVGGQHYYLDYLGFIVTWYYDVPGGGEDPIEDPETGDDGADIGWDIIYGEGLIGTLGALGLIGMVAIPALAIWVFRNTDEGKMNVFVKMLAAFMIFLSFFMVSVSGV